MVSRTVKRRIFIGATLLLPVIIAAFLLAANANRLLKSELQRRIGKDFAVRDISIDLNGVNAEEIMLKKNDKLLFRADRLRLRADLLGALRKNFSVVHLAFERPRLLLEIDRKGEVVNPFAGEERKDHANDPGTAPPVSFRKITVADGELSYVDNKITQPPHLTKIESINIESTDVSVPFRDAWSAYSLTAAIPGAHATASLSVQGKTNLATYDTDARVRLRNLDITRFKPYFQKRGDVDVSRGPLDVSMDVTVRNKMIRAPGKAVLRDLEFTTGKGVGNAFMGVPRTLVVSLLKSGNGEIAFDFTLEGNISDPKFNIRESFAKKLVAGLAGKLGLGAVQAGKSVVDLGVKGVSEAGKGISDVGKRIGKIFE